MDRTNHSYQVRAGNWVRVWRAVYRLANYPEQADSQYSLWGVWSCNRKGQVQGVYSHETALVLYGLTDLQPEKLHMTVPRGFRRHGRVPPVLRFHYGSVPSGECEERSGYKVTRPARTIRDIVMGGAVSPEFVRQAVHQALEQGYLALADHEALMAAPRIGTRLREIMGQSRG
jgi:predicted transcriptional regulator of viral defense system